MVGAPILRIVVVGDPVPKGRPVGGIGFHGRPTFRTPKKTVAYENLVKTEAARQLRGFPPLDCPVAVTVRIYMPFLGSFSPKKREDAVQGRIRPAVKPDASNIFKAVEDALNGHAYTDDGRIVDLHIHKFYGSVPRVEVDVVALDAKGPR